MGGADRFEAREGWVPANAEGSVWCYRTRGNAGVLAFKRTESGEPLYEATHQDCYATDATIATSSRHEAVRFAMSGAAAAPAPAAGDAPVASGAPVAGAAEADRGARTTPWSEHVSVLGAAWDRYVEAAAALSRYVKEHGHPDTPAQRALLASALEALALLDGDASTGGRQRSELSVAVNAVLRRAVEVLGAEGSPGSSQPTASGRQG